MLAELSLEPECRRGHGAMYDAVNRGEVQVARLRRALAGLPVPAWDHGRIRLAADVSNWLRPDAETSPERLFCHCYARGKGNAQMIPGWPYSFITALEPGRTSWTLPLDAVRLGPADDATAVTAAQVREVVLRIIAAGHWHDGDPGILVVFDSGYDLTRLAWLLPGPARRGGRPAAQRPGYVLPRPAPRTRRERPPARHGAALRLADPQTWPAPAVTTATATARYGTAPAMAWGRLHQQLASRAGWENHDGELPVIEGTLIRLQVDYLPGDRSPEPLWLWSSRAGTSAAEVNRTWQAFLRRFDIEHTFRFLKQVLGGNLPSPATRPPRTAGPGSSSPAMPSSASPAPSPPTCACPGSSPARRLADPGPRPPRVPEHPPDPARPGQRAETRQTRTRPPARIKEPPPGHPPRRRQDRQANRTHRRKPSARRLNNKLRARRHTKNQATARVSCRYDTGSSVGNPMCPRGDLNTRSREISPIEEIMRSA